MKRFLMAVLLAVVALGAVLVGRALSWPSTQKKVPAAAPFTVDANAVAAHLSAVVRIATVSDPQARDPATFAALQALLRGQFPNAYSKFEVEEVDGSLLLTWKGSEPSLPPILLLAHQDVVPVEPGTEKDWVHPAWSGDIEGGFVWGRGTMDDKAALVSILEAVEVLLAAGHTPKRTLLLGFGHDEEVGGTGAAALAARLKERGIKPALVLDEGLMVTQGIVPGIQRPVAILGVAEKGFLSLELSTVSAGGHSSMPPLVTAIGRLARALDKLETTPTPGSLEGTAGLFLDAVGPEMGFGLKLVMANRWLLAPLVLKIYDGKPSTRASVHTTVAPTMLSAGVKDNVLAHEAKAVVNFRIRPGESRADVVAWVHRTVADDGVVVAESKASISSDPSPITPVDAPGYRQVEKTLRSVMPEVVVAPGLMLGATDARHFIGLSPAVIRFGPMVLTQEDLARYHGVNERLAVANLGQMVRFYRQLILDSDTLE